MDKDFGVDNIDIQSNKYVYMYIKEGIFYVRYKAIQLLDIEAAKRVVEDRLKMKNGVSYPTFADVSLIKNSTKEARDYLATEGNKLIIANALLIKSPMLRMMANFFIKVNKPLNPTQMFTDENEALSWLQQFKT